MHALYSYTNFFPALRTCHRQFPRSYAVVLLLAMLTSNGCTSKEAHSSVPPDIRGAVTGVIPANDRMRNGGVIGFLRVEGRRDTGMRYDRADVTITDTTLIYQKSGGNLRAAEFNAVQEGDTVEANFVGPVLERYPVHGTAGRLVIFR